MSDSPTAGRSAADGQDPAYEIARELVGVLPFGARDDTVARCARITERVEDGRALTAVVRRMLHVLLATRDLGWPGPDAPLSVRRVAAADLFFDATQTVLGDDDWKGPNGVEFALLKVLADRICRIAPLPAAGHEPGREPGTERLGHLHRTRNPRSL